MYSKFGYTVYRRVLDYYTGENDEDAFGKIFLSVFMYFRKASILFLFEFERHEESNAKGRGKNNDHTSTSSSYPG